MLHLNHPQVFLAIIVQKLLVLAQFLPPKSELFLFQPNLLVRRCQNLLLNLTCALELVVDLLNIFLNRCSFKLVYFLNPLFSHLVFALSDLFLLLYGISALLVKLLNPFLGGYHLLHPLKLLLLVFCLVRRYRFAWVLNWRESVVLKINYLLVQWCGFIPQCLFTLLSSLIRFS